SMSPNGSKVFQTTFNGSNQMPVPKDGFKAIAVGYIGNKVFYASVESKGSITSKLSLRPTEISQSELSEKLKALETQEIENSVEEDLKYQAKFFEEEKYNEELRIEQFFLISIIMKVDHCCEVYKTELSRLL